MASISKLKTLVLSVGLTVASILVCLLVSETYLTIRYNQERALMESRVIGKELCTMASNYTELIYTFIPNKCGTNAHGFRDYEYSYSKPKGVSRVVIIGDSVALGQRMDLRDIFGKVLERKLNLSAKGGGKERKVEVIVLANSGYSTSQELFLLKHEAFRYSPDLIIWSYVLNDPAHPVFHNANGELGRYYFKPAFHTANYVSRKLFEINEQRKAANCGEEYHALLHCVYWGQIASNIREIGNISEKQGVPIIFLIHPILEEDSSFDNYSLATVHTKLGAAAADAGLPVLDLLKAYRSHNPWDLTLTSEHGFDPWHPNEEGHRIAADALVKFISEGNYLH